MNCVRVNHGAKMLVKENVSIFLPLITKEEAQASYDQKASQFFGHNAYFNLQSSHATPKSNQKTVFTTLFFKEPVCVGEVRGLLWSKSQSQQVSYKKYIYIFAFNYKIRNLSVL